MTKRSYKQLIKRYIFFVFGLFVMSIGVVLSAKANLGTSPISSVPYVYSLQYPLTMGNFTIIMHAFFVLLQIAMLRKNYQAIQIFQMFVAVVFGYIIDFSMIILSWVNVSGYFAQFSLMLLSCVFVALGVAIEVKANVVMLAGEGLALSLSEVTHMEFAKAKVICDASLVVFALVSSFIFFKEIHGVREGTVIAAVIVGPISKVFIKALEPFEKKYLN